MVIRNELFDQFSACRNCRYFLRFTPSSGLDGRLNAEELIVSSTLPFGLAVSLINIYLCLVYTVPNLYKLFIIISNRATARARKSETYSALSETGSLSRTAASKRRRVYASLLE